MRSHGPFTCLYLVRLRKEAQVMLRWLGVRRGAARSREAVAAALFAASTFLQLPSQFILLQKESIVVHIRFTRHLMLTSSYFTWPAKPSQDQRPGFPLSRYLFSAPLSENSTMRIHPQVST